MNPGTSLMLRLWAGLMIVAAFLMGPLAIFSFGFIVFSALSLFVLRDLAGKTTETDWIGSVLVLICTVWFFLNVAAEIGQELGGNPADYWGFATALVAFLFPPLIAHVYYLEACSKIKLGRGWKMALKLLYPVSYGSAVYWLLVFFGVLPLFLGQVWLVVTMTACFSVAGIYGALVLQKIPSASEGGEEGTQRRLHTLLLGCMVAVFLLIIFGALETHFTSSLSVFSRSLPILFLFVSSFYEHRFGFFDVFVKKATLFFLTFLLIYAYFSLVAPLVSDWFRPDARVLMHSLALLPLVMSLPFLFRAFENWLDRVWLQRVFSTAEAVGYFLNGIQQVSSEEGAGRIRITVAGSRDILRIRVSDNGPGFDLSSAGRSGKNSGYGLHNIRERLRRYYGSGADVELSGSHGETTAELRLPIPRQTAPESAVPAPGAARRGG